MKRIYLLALMCFAAMTLLSSCGRSQTDVILNGFEDLVEEVEKKKGNLTAEEWAKMEADFNKRFEELGIEEFDESQFSTMEKIKLVALTVRWTAAMAESAPTLMESAIEELNQE